jgi:hypothetical protein
MLIEMCCTGNDAETHFAVLTVVTLDCAKEIIWKEYRERVKERV